MPRLALREGSSSTTMAPLMVSVERPTRSSRRTGTKRKASVIDLTEDSSPSVGPSTSSASNARPPPLSRRTASSSSEDVVITSAGGGRPSHSPARNTRASSSTTRVVRQRREPDGILHDVILHVPRRPASRLVDLTAASNSAPSVPGSAAITQSAVAALPSAQRGVWNSEHTSLCISVHATAWSEVLVNL